MVVLELRQLRGGGARRDGGGQKGGDAPEVPGPVYVVQAERGSEVAGWMMLYDVLVTSLYVKLVTDGEGVLRGRCCKGAGTCPVLKMNS